MFKNNKPVKEELKPKDLKEAKKSDTNDKKWFQNPAVFGILGIVLLSVFVSIAFSAGVILITTESSLTRIMTIPMIGFDMLIIFYAFWKIFK